MTCGCDGLGDASVQKRFPAIERLLYSYVMAQIQAGNSFYISPDLNSSSVRFMPMNVRPPQGLGDDVDVFDTSGNLISDSYAPGTDISTGSVPAGFFDTIISTASSIGNAVLAALPSIAKIQGAQAQINAAGAVNGVLGRTGTNIPGAIAGQTIAAAQKDILGVSPTVLLLAGGALLLFMAVR